MSGDGRADLLFTAGGALNYLPNRSTTNPGHVPFQGSAAPIGRIAPSHLFAAGDHHADLLIHKRSAGRVSYLPNNASTNPGHVPFHGNATRMVVGIPGGAVVALGDLTGDRHAHLLYVHGGALDLLENRSGSNPGHVPFHCQAHVVNGSGFGSVAQLTVADVSGDGHADLLFADADHRIFELDDRSATNPGHAYFHGTAREVAHAGTDFVQLGFRAPAA